MPTEELTVTDFKQKDLRLYEISLQRFSELPEGIPQVSVNVGCFTETNFGTTPTAEKVILAKLTLEVNILGAAAGAIQPSIAKVTVSIQAAFTFEDDVQIVPDLKASQTTLTAVGDRLLPMAIQQLKRMCVEANLPLFALPINMAELSDHLKNLQKK